jgi:carboxyl-terminal processing protease
VQWELLDDGIGLIIIYNFDDRCAQESIKAIETLTDQGAQALIFDVRGNHGGEVTSVVSVLDQVVGKGIITTYHDINGNVFDVKRATSAEKLDIPMVVLTGRNTVSAAELFACTLKDYELATLIGTQTYGKGVGQRPYMLTDGSYIYITALYYDPPKSPNYHGVGIAPDLKVELPEQYQNMNVMRIPQSEDTQLVAAIATLNGEQE